MRKANFTIAQSVWSLLLVATLSVFATANASAQGQCALVCNNLVNLSMDQDCSVELLPDMITEGAIPTACGALQVQVKIGNTWQPSTGTANFIATSSLVGQTREVRVRQVSGGAQMCWGFIKFEDKLAPVITCPDVTISCAATSLSSAANATATDNCSGAITPTVFNVEWFDGTCEDDFSATAERTWIATDASGNTASCVQTISLERPSVADVDFPADVTINCTGGAINTNPSSTGTPFITFDGTRFNLFPDASYCELQVTHTDQIIPVCDGTYKILRTWQVISWCEALSNFPPTTNPQLYIQLIKVVDNNGPVFASCPDDITVGTNTSNCCSTQGLPDVIVEDACSRIRSAQAKIFGFTPTGEAIGVFTVNAAITSFPGNNFWDNDTLVNFPATTTPCLPVGTHEVQYIVTDDCGNSSVCEFSLTVEDQSAPYPIAHEWTQVGIGAGTIANTTVCTSVGSGSIVVSAASFDNGSYDDCGDVFFRVRRMDSNSCENNSEFRPSVKFCCSDVGDTVMVIFRVYDVNPGSPNVGVDALEGHFSDVMINVLVEDKLRPTCSAPAWVTTTCEAFDNTLWTYGNAIADDNCCLDPTKVYRGQCGLTHTVDFSRFDTVCNRGTITRNFRAFDCYGNSSQCSQRIIVNYNQNYFVRFPNDVIVTACNSSGNYGAPTFFGEDCELLATSYTDEIYTVVPDACFKIERTWNVINWCTYNPNLNPLLQFVPNPNPNATTNATQNLPGPIVSAPGTVGVWAPTVVSISPGAPQTNYSTFWQQNGNGYTYKQIIKIIDTQAPIINNCSPSDTFCDVTNNDPLFWNSMVWWDNGIQSHDLCEGDADLSITTTDLCSKANVSVRFLLFLDLDGDNVQETVINSTTLGGGPGGLGWNRVPYNNVNGAGEFRSFDGRPVQPNQKYGFALQQTVSGNNRTAAVRWNTLANENSFVVPQLPYGRHKIKWYVNDGCGNEKECVKDIWVRDCKAPIVVCHFGLSSNIGPTGVCPTLWVTDFLAYAYDNCTPTPLLKYGIRKSGTGTGFPYAAGSTTEGNQEVSYGCQDLPAGATFDDEFVEVWAIDRAGNASYCETYVRIQDNSNVCGNGTHASVAGALKTEEVEGVEASQVSLNGNGITAAPLTTDAQGAYMFSNAMPMGANSQVIAANNQDPKNGVTTYDLLLISRHILGLEPMDSPYKMIAADANKSNTITTFDIVEIRKLILGIYTELPNNTSWRFVDKSQAFANPQNPFAETIRESISLQQVFANQFEQDFVGVKVGDINLSAQANNLMAADDRSAGTLMFDVADRKVAAGEEVVVNFKSAEKVAAFQFTMNLNGLEVEQIIPGANMTDENFAVFANAVTTSAEGAGEFAVKFRASKAGNLSEMISASSRITRAVAYSEAGENLDIAFRFNGQNGVVAGANFELLQNTPNPVKNTTAVAFNLPSAGEATLTVTDAEGRVVKVVTGEFAKGLNTINLNRADLQTGVLFYQLNSADFSATKKMIVVE
jgi:hypothetical protein